MVGVAHPESRALQIAIVKPVADFGVFIEGARQYQATIMAENFF
jgi:hypothetical protein